MSVPTTYRSNNECIEKTVPDQYEDEESWKLEPRLQQHPKLRPHHRDRSHRRPERRRQAQVNALTWAAAGLDPDFATLPGARYASFV